MAEGGVGKVVKPVIALAAWLALAGALEPAEQRYLNTAAGVAYTGSRTCAGCHTQIYNAYLKTAMGRSMGSPGERGELPHTEKAVTIQKSNHFYQVTREGEHLYQSEYALDPSGKIVFKTSHKLEYAVGSGVNGISYIVRRGDYLFQAPLAFYSRTKTWGLSPGYESGNYGFSRPIHAACISCHSGRARPVGNSEGMYANPPFEELAIGCENCHGPGSLHVSERSKPGSRSASSGRTIVNPAKLSARLAEDICMNCHQAGGTRVLQPGKQALDFRPGTPLAGIVAIFTTPLKAAAAGGTDLLEHHASMKLSKCYSGSEGRLNCLTCHSPHGMPAGRNAVAYYREKCLSCHQPDHCKTAAAGNSGDCVACHMPKREIGFIAHSALTNHRITARSGEPLPPAAFAQTTEDLPDLIFVNRPESPVAIPDIILLQAYGELMDQEPAYQERYLQLLDKVAQSAPDEPLVLTALGRKALREGKIAEAVEYLSKTIEAGFSSQMTYEDLAEALSHSMRKDESIEVLRRGIAMSPYAPRLYKRLATRYIERKDYGEARRIMERYLELFPEDDFMRQLLSQAPAGP
jgi:hypothetical protein